MILTGLLQQFFGKSPIDAALDRDGVVRLADVRRIDGEVENPITFVVPWGKQFEFANAILGHNFPSGAGIPQSHPDDPRYVARSVNITPRGVFRKQDYRWDQAAVEVEYAIPQPEYTI